jgi:hypothetical protein
VQFGSSATLPEEKIRMWMTANISLPPRSCVPFLLVGKRTALHRSIFNRDKEVLLLFHQCLRVKRLCNDNLTCTPDRRTRRDTSKVVEASSTMRCSRYQVVAGMRRSSRLGSIADQTPAMANSRRAKKVGGFERLLSPDGPQQTA